MNTVGNVTYYENKFNSISTMIEYNIHNLLTSIQISVILVRNMIVVYSDSINYNIILFDDIKT